MKKNILYLALFAALILGATNLYEKKSIKMEHVVVESIALPIVLGSGLFDIIESASFALTTYNFKDISNEK